MKNAKGFTLVELLAVIVILAIIALITAPVILNVIDDARESGAKDKTWGTMDAVELAYTQALAMDGYTAQSTEDGIIVFNREASYIDIDFGKAAEAGKTPAFNNRLITMSGETPSSGRVSIDTDTGEIYADDLYFTKGGTFACSAQGKTEIICCKNQETCKFPK